MRICKPMNGLTLALLTTAIAFSSLISFSFIAANEAQAEFRNSGVQLKRNTRRNNVNSTFHRRGVIDQLRRDVNNPIYVRREIFNAVKGQRSGVRFGNPNGFNNVSGIRLIQRDIQIRQRNADTLRRNELRKLQGSIRRSQPNGRFLSRNEQADLLNAYQLNQEPISSNQGVGGFAGASACPTKHNCGYRIYSDGTGPRIITPGVQLGKGLPKFDGLDGVKGPKVLRLN